MGMLYPPFVFYPPIRVLSFHPCFIPSSVFYPLIHVLSPHPCFIPLSVFYPPIRVFIPSSVFYPPIRVLSPHPCFIPSSVFYPLIRTRIRPSVSVFYPNPFTVYALAKISWELFCSPWKKNTKQLLNWHLLLHYKAAKSIINITRVLICFLKQTY